MICDSMRNFRRYSALAPDVWAKLEAFFQEINGSIPEAGAYELDGDALKVIVADTRTAPRESGKSEAHKRFIDIHIPLSGCENIICRADSCDMKEVVPFDEAADCVLYESCDGADFYLEPGYFLLVYPGEPHQPLVGPGKSIVKLIVKIDRNLMA